MCVHRDTLHCLQPNRAELYDTCMSSRLQVTEPQAGKGLAEKAPPVEILDAVCRSRSIQVRWRCISRNLDKIDG